MYMCNSPTFSSCVNYKKLNTEWTKYYAVCLRFFSPFLSEAVYKAWTFLSVSRQYKLWEICQFDKKVAWKFMSVYYTRKIQISK